MNKNICLFPGCNNSVAAITRQNARFSKMYCEEHSKGVDVECSVCHTKHHSRISDVMPVLLNSKPIICRKCSVTALNKTEAMKEKARELGKRTGSINIAKALEALSKCKKNKDWVKEHPNFFRYRAVYRRKWRAVLQRYSLE